MAGHLTPTDEAIRTDSPPLQGRGRGWGLTAARLVDLKCFAREMRCEPTAPELRLWQHLRNSQLAGHKFRRQAGVGPFVADFMCPQKAFIVEVDGETHDVETDRRRDAVLNRLGFRVLHVTNQDVMRNLDGVLTAISLSVEAAPDRWASPHPNPSPEGEGFS